MIVDSLCVLAPHACGSQPFFQQCSTFKELSQVPVLDLAAAGPRDRVGWDQQHSRRPEPPLAADTLHDLTNQAGVSLWAERFISDLGDDDKPLGPSSRNRAVSGFVMDPFSQAAFSVSKRSSGDRAGRWRAIARLSLLLA